MKNLFKLYLYIYIMNILEAYILQKNFLTIVITCLDVNLLKEISKNIASDIGADLIDLSKYFNNISTLDEIDITSVNESVSNEKVKIIASPLFPDYLFNIKINFHINLSLNKNFINNNNIDKNLIEIHNSSINSIKINKFININKFKNNNEIEDNLFMIIMQFITNNLDNGNYIKRITKDDNKNNEISDDLNSKIDEQIMEDIEIDTEDPLLDVHNDITASDFDMDEDLTPIKKIYDDKESLDLHEIRQNNGINKKKLRNKINQNEVKGSRFLKNNYIKKKMNFKYT